MNAAATLFYSRHGHQMIPAADAVIKPRHGVFALARSGDVVLLVLQSFANGFWEMPGGGMEEGEQQDDAIRREWAEETGIDFAPLRATGQEYYHTRGYYAEDVNEFWVYDQTFYLYDYDAPVTTGTTWLNSEGDQAAWFPVSALPQMKINRAHWLAFCDLLPELCQPIREVHRSDDELLRPVPERGTSSAQSE